MIRANWPDWLQELAQRLPGEKPYEHIARIFRAFHGCSVKNDPERLYALFYVNEPTQERAIQVAEAKTNCATTARCVVCLAGSKLDKFTRPYQLEAAVSWLIEAGAEVDANIDLKKYPDAWERIGPGDLLLYHGGGNNWHVEIALSEVDIATGIADHAGGGKKDNGILIDRSDIRSSAGRPLVLIIRGDRLLPVD